MLCALLLFITLCYISLYTYACIYRSITCSYAIEVKEENTTKDSNPEKGNTDKVNFYPAIGGELIHSVSDLHDT